MPIAYLINQYPKISHTFIRREIIALESQGFAIQPFSIRPMADSVIDPADHAEAQRTIALLAQPPMRFVIAFARRLTRPLKLIDAMSAAVWMGLHSPRGMVGYLIYLIEACLLYDYLRSYSHLHVHFGTNSAAVAYLCRKLGGPPYSITIHGPEEFDKTESLFLAEKVSAAVFSIVDCSYSRAQLMRLLPAERWPDVHLVRCAMNDDYRDLTPVPVRGSRKLVSVARLEIDKGLTVLIDALHSLPADARPTEMVLIGDGTLRPMLERQVEAAGLGDVVRFIGWADEAKICQHILEADAVTLPSLAENLPLTLIDSFALGRPVIATYLAGIPELVRPGENGWLVPAGEVEPLAEAICEVVTALPQRLDAMGCAGHDLVHRQHNSVTESAKLAALFRGLR